MSLERAGATVAMEAVDALPMPAGAPMPTMETMMADAEVRPNVLTLPEGMREAVAARRGAEHCFAAGLDPSATALVVVDMQNAFMMDGAG